MQQLEILNVFFFRQYGSFDISILIVAILFPSGNIVVNIIANTIHFILVADDVVVETRLPGE